MQIEEANDGYIVTIKYYDRDNKVTGEKIYEEERFVFEFDGLNETDALKRLLEFIAEHLGYPYDKYGENNINITFDKSGHKID